MCSAQTNCVKLSRHKYPKALKQIKCKPFGHRFFGSQGKALTFNATSAALFHPEYSVTLSVNG